MTALTPQPQGIREVQRPSGNQSRVFAQAVPGHELGLQALSAQHAESGNRNGEQCGLGVFGELQCLCRAFEAKRGERKPERAVRFVKYFTSRGKAIREAFSHAGVLRTLAGKQKCWFHNLTLMED